MSSAASVLEGPAVRLADASESRQMDTLRWLSKQFLDMLRDPGVVDVVVNPDGRIWANRIGSGFRPVARMDESTVYRILASTATIRKAELNHSNPILETDFPLDGSRIEGLVSPIVAGAALALRPLNRQTFTLDDYMEQGIITNRDDETNHVRFRDNFLEEVRGKGHAEIICLAVKYRRNIVVAGATGSGKTTAANMVLRLIAQLTPRHRVVVMEDTRELRCPVENHVSLLATAHISLLACLKASLRLAPDRIVVGEVRDENARELLSSWNTGHPGGLATIHADDARSALRRFEQLLHSATAETRETIAQAVNVVLFMDKEPGNASGRKLREIMLVHGYDRAKNEYEVEFV